MSRFAFILAISLFPFSEVQAQPALKPHITQLHIHGWSNHNGATRPGSIGFHNWQADSAHTDVLWWTEHHNLFNQDTLALSFSASYLDTATLSIIGPPGITNGSFHGWKCLKRQGIQQASLSNDTLNLQITSQLNEWETFSYSPRSLLGLIKDLRFVKPLASHPVLSFNIDPGINSVDDSKISIVFRLSWQHRGEMAQDIVTFNLVHSSLAGGSWTNQKDSVFVKIPIQPGQQQIHLDVKAAAMMLDHGIDNTISDIEFRLMARNGAATAATVSQFHLIPVEPEADSIIELEKEILEHYSGIGNTHNILGVEYSRAQHLNGYVPKTTVDKQIFMGSNQGNVLNWVNRVHQAGGLVSYNHMFGTNWGLGTDESQDYRADTLAEYLIANQVFDADILEVGYIKRGGADLRRHLRVWDKLTARGLFLYGNGVSDSHGDLWMDNSNIFHTWIYAKDSSDTELLSALSRGKMTFGNHQLFKGDFWYSAGNLHQGDRGFAQAPSAELKVHLTDAPPGSVVKLTQAFIDEHHDITYICDELPVNLLSLPVLNLSKPCFFRLGVYTADGKPLIFGQPVVVLGVTEDSIPLPPGENTLSVYPNPAKGHFNLELQLSEPGNYKITLFNDIYQEIEVIEERYFYEGVYGFRYLCNHLPAGVYVVSVSGEKSNMSRKLVISE